MDEKTQNAINEFDRAIIKAAETAVSDWKYALKNRENGNVAAVRCIQRVQDAVDNKEQAIEALHSELPRALHIYTDHILSTIGCPQVFESWLEVRGKAPEEIEKILRLFYELGKKEAGVKDPDV
jgi:hypothetical protein